MKLVSWNIRRASRSRRDAVLEALALHEPDVAVIVDPPRGRELDRLRDGLVDIGLDRIHAPDDDDGPPRVLLAARHPIRRVAPSARDLELHDRWAEATIPSLRLRVAGVYIPVTGKRYERKLRMYGHILDAARRRRDRPFVVVGDWNTGDHLFDKTHSHRPSRFAAQYRMMAEAGYVEAWRHMNPDAAEFSWYRHDARGYRIDHAFVSPALLPRLRACRYSHDERLAGAPDHSMLVVELGAAG